MPDPSIDRLRTKLEDARNANSDGGNRQRAVESITAVLEFLREADFAQELRTPFTQLLGSFDDLDNGFTPEIFKAAPVGVGARKRSVFNLSQAAFASAAVTILVEDARYNLSDAVRRAAPYIDVSVGYLQEFRKNIKKRKAPNVASEDYWWALHHFRAIDDPGPEKKAVMMLETARANKG